MSKDDHVTNHEINLAMIDVVQRNIGTCCWSLIEFNEVASAIYVRDTCTV